mmetsp:Transcript_49453/g.143406  ORF Transcript_49453/g.143406 Transcript_49453/m.143406 type:complete len:310 (-) Transcript_49453:32-961(-)
MFSTRMVLTCGAGNSCNHLKRRSRKSSCAPRMQKVLTPTTNHTKPAWTHQKLLPSGMLSTSSLLMKSIVGRSRLLATKCRGQSTARTTAPTTSRILAFSLWNSSSTQPSRPALRTSSWGWASLTRRNQSVYALRHAMQPFRLSSSAPPVARPDVTSSLPKSREKTAGLSLRSTLKSASTARTPQLLKAMALIKGPVSASPFKVTPATSLWVLGDKVSFRLGAPGTVPEPATPMPSLMMSSKVPRRPSAGGVLLTSTRPKSPRSSGAARTGGLRMVSGNKERTERPEAPGTVSAHAARKASRPSPAAPRG